VSEHADDPRGRFPLAEHAADTTVSATGKRLAEVSLDAVVSGACSIADLRISADALRQQAEIARAAARASLAANLDRAAEMTRLPQAEVLRIYEMLRPGRCRSKQDLLAVAHRLKRDHAAPELARLVETAADVYARRGLFSKRF
jgi:propanediol dehydratase small subunit